MEKRVNSLKLIDTVSQRPEKYEDYIHKAMLSVKDTISSPTVIDTGNLDIIEQTAAMGNQQSITDIYS